MSKNLTKEWAADKLCITELKKQVLPRLLRPRARGKTLFVVPVIFFNDDIDTEPGIEKSFLIVSVVVDAGDDVTLLLTATRLTWSTAS